MKSAKILTILVMALGLILSWSGVSKAAAMGTAFTYQGHLYDDNYPANGLYDFQFKLFDSESDGNQLGEVNKPEVNVVDGYFTVELDFGSVFDGNKRWLQIGIRPGEMNDPNAHPVLSPRQEIRPTPYALHTQSLFADSAVVVVNPGDDLQDAYDWLKSSDRDAEFGALSSTNWRTLIMNLGTYTQTSTLTFDTNFITITDITPTINEDTIITSAISEAGGEGEGATVAQTANTIMLSGFTIQNTATPTAPCFSCAFRIGATDNADSVYKFMDFRVPGSASLRRTSCIAHDNCSFKGTWLFCNADHRAYRIEPGTGEYDPTMYYCTAKTSSFCGDRASSPTKGYHIGCIADYYSFSSCGEYGSPIHKDAYYQDCIGAKRCYGIGVVVEGTFIRCRGQEDCFAGTWKNTTNKFGKFRGYAEDCIASGKSFGAGHSSSKNSGTLVNCTLTDMPEAMYCEGAFIRNSRLVVSANNIDCLVLTDPNTKIYNSDLIVVQGGTGIPINDDGNARNVVAAHCRMNNASNDTDGLGVNVTNLVTGYSIVDNDIK